MRSGIAKGLVVLSVILTPVTLHYLYDSISLPAYVHRPRFDPSGDDTLVFIHIQKTSGSHFLDCLTAAKINEEQLCTATDRKVKRAKCPRPGAANDRESWLVSERTLGWICGVHSSFSEMRACLPSRLDREWGPKPSRRFHYITMIRHPILRYLSEYMHVRRGATWSRKRVCSGKEVVNDEMPPCYEGYYTGLRWSNVTMESFVSCDTNWANNRQTFALTDLEQFGCFNRSVWKQREVELLNSAMSNLRDMAFFGLAEYQEESGALFQETFDLVMPSGSLEQKPLAVQHSYEILREIATNETIYQRIVRNNHLDMQLYQYALKLFASRLKMMGVQVDLKKVDKDLLFLHPSF